MRLGGINGGVDINTLSYLEMQDVFLYFNQHDCDIGSLNSRRLNQTECSKDPLIHCANIY